MTNEELLSVAEIVERATNRFNAQAAYHRERFDEHVKLIASMKADHEAKMVEHRAAFGARTGADEKIIEGLRIQVQDMRAEMERLRGDERKAYQAGDALRAEVAALQERLRASIARGDFAQMEVAALKSQSKTPKYKVGDKLESRNRSLGQAITIVGVRTVYDCQADGAAYSVGHSEDELTERYEQTPPEATHAEPDLTQLHAKGKEAWSDVPNATQWVEEMRGNSEATHDTEEGKAVAESAVRTEPVAEEIKVGDVAKVVGASGDLTAQSDIGKIGEVLKIDFGDGTVLLSGGAGWVNRCDVRKVTT